MSNKHHRFIKQKSYQSRLLFSFFFFFPKHRISKLETKSDCIMLDGSRILDLLGHRSIKQISLNLRGWERGTLTEAGRRIPDEQSSIC